MYNERRSYRRFPVNAYYQDLSQNYYYGLISLSANGFSVHLHESITKRAAVGMRLTYNLVIFDTVWTLPVKLIRKVDANRLVFEIDLNRFGERDLWFDFLAFHGLL